MKIKQGIENIVEKAKNNWKKSLAIILATGVIGTASLKDNVHLGSVTLNNVQENHYAIGITPIIKVNDGQRVNGNLYSYGLLTGGNNLKNNSHINGNAHSTGLFSFGPRGDLNLLTNNEIGMDYTPTKEGDKK